MLYHPIEREIEIGGGCGNGWNVSVKFRIFVFLGGEKVHVFFFVLALHLGIRNKGV